MTPQELKNSILQLAIQGKLVEQRPEEGTAEELYRQIQAEKQALVKAGKIKKEKPLPEITEDEKPFDIPESWMWVRLSNVLQSILVPQRDKPKEFGGSIPWCRIEDIEGKYLNGTKSGQYVSSDTVRTMNLKVNPVGTVISANSASVGEAAITTVECITNQTFVGLVCIYGLYNEFLYYFLLANKPKLRRMGSGTTILYVSQEKYKMIPFPLPPLSEQKRIVAKIEELLPLIDRYEQAWSRLEDFNKRFPGDMQKSILQMAIQGKLVEQRSEEGTGEELYRQIQAEKQALIKSGKIKKDKPLPEIAEDEIPFDIPESWKWVRFSAVIDVRDGTHDTPKYVTKGIPLVTSKNLVDGRIDFSTAKNISEEDAAAINIRSRVDDGDILFAMIGTIGNPVLVKKDCEFSIKNMALFKQIDASLLDMRYVLFFLQTVQTDMKAIANASVQSFVSLTLLRNYLFPLPPMGEQKRIVAKLEALLPLCERLR